VKTYRGSRYLPLEDIVFVPRIFIVAGLALIAIALGASGHGLLWLIPFVWFVGGRRHAWYACGPGYHQRNRSHRYDRHEGGYDTHRPDQVPADGTAEPVPDPSRDRHEAFPSAR
jgi:hypothetical protein